MKNIFNIEVKIYHHDSTGTKYLQSIRELIVSGEDSFDAATEAFVKVYENLLEIAPFVDTPIGEVKWEKNHTTATTNWGRFGEKLTLEFKITQTLESGI